MDFNLREKEYPSSPPISSNSQKENYFPDSDHDVDVLVLDPTGSPVDDRDDDIDEASDESSRPATYTYTQKHNKSVKRKNGSTESDAKASENNHRAQQRKTRKKGNKPSLNAIAYGDLFRSPELDSAPSQKGTHSQSNDDDEANAENMETSGRIRGTMLKKEPHADSLMYRMGFKRAKDHHLYIARRREAKRVSIHALL